MRISPVLLLLPVLVSSGACTQTVPSAIANDDRLASPQPAIASPVPSPLTIESLAGTYKAVVNEQQLAEQIALVKPMYTKEGGAVDEEVKKRLETSFRQAYELYQLKIYADGTFELLHLQLHGRVKLAGNKLIFTYDLAQLSTGRNDTNTLPKLSTITLDVSADRKKLLYYDPKQPSLPPGVYIKQ